MRNTYYVPNTKCSKCFSCIDSFKLQIRLWSLQVGFRSIERVRDSPRFIQLVSGWPRVWTQAVVLKPGSIKPGSHLNGPSWWWLSNPGSDQSQTSREELSRTQTFWAFEIPPALSVPTAQRRHPQKLHPAERWLTESKGMLKNRVQKRKGFSQSLPAKTNQLQPFSVSRFKF